MKYFHIAGIAYCIMPIDMILNGFIIGSARTKFLFITNIFASTCEVLVIIILYKVFHYDNMFSLGYGVITYTLTTFILNTLYCSKSIL